MNDILPKYTECCCLVCVRESNVAIVENCGSFSQILKPGLSCVRWPFEKVRAPMTVRIQQLDVICDTKTRDNVFVHVKVAVLYKVLPLQVFEAFYKLTDHRSQIQSYVFDGIRASFPKLDLDDTFSSKDDIATHVQTDLKTLMSEYGYEIVNTLIVDIDPDKSVQRAMNEINASQRLREAAQYKAEAEKILLVKAAEAESESKYLVGVGVAKQRRAIMDGLKSSVSEFSDKVHGASAKDVIDLLLLTQYFDTIKDVGVKGAGGERTLFLPHGPHAVADLRDSVAGSFMVGLGSSKR